MRLRPFTAADAADVFAACRDPLVRRFTTFPEPRDQRDSRAWIESQARLREHDLGLDLAIVDPTQPGDRALGSIGIAEISLTHQRAQLGYWLAPAARGRGLATEAVRLLGGWATSGPLGLARLELHIDVENADSRRVAERAGYGFEALLRSYLHAKGRRWDIALYARLACPPDSP